MALRSIRTGATAIPENNVLQLTTDLIAQSGVLNPGNGGFLVTAPNSNLTVSVAVGRAYLVVTGGNTYPIISDSVVTQAITTNSSGNPRITSIVLYKNLSISSNSDDSNTNFITAVDGTPAASPSAPSGSTILSAIGSVNPYIVLANVTVASGATSLTNSNVTDTRASVTLSAQFLASTGTNGWTASSDTFVYVSSYQFKVAGVDRTSVYTKGTRIMFTNNGATFYGAVATSSFSTDTTVTTAVTSDYAITNSAITNPYYSYQACPQGYPGFFNYPLSFTGFSSNPTGVIARFSITGRVCTVMASDTGRGTSNSTSKSWTLPVAASSLAATVIYVTDCFNNASQGQGDHIITAGSTTAACYPYPSGAWVSSGLCDLFPNGLSISYEI